MCIICLEDKNYTRSEFEKEVGGLGVHAVRKALIFYQLDERIKRLEREGLLKYGIAVDLFEIEDKEDGYCLALQAVTNQWNLKEARERIKYYLTTKKYYPKKAYSKEAQKFFTDVEKSTKEVNDKQITLDLVKMMRIIESGIPHNLEKINLISSNNKDKIFSNRLLIKKFVNARNNFHQLKTQLENKL